jgi:1,4-dihydroxy-2-naphthoyl-CoA synthase
MEWLVLPSIGCAKCFRPKTTAELYQAFYDAQEDTSIGVVLLSAEGPSSKDGVYSFVVVAIKTQEDIKVT